MSLTLSTLWRRIPSRFLVNRILCGLFTTASPIRTVLTVFVPNTCPNNDNSIVRKIIVLITAAAGRTSNVSYISNSISTNDVTEHEDTYFAAT
eukprot:CAMPEP_0194413300 /NCGR_PEP_ID=MMETSP0176-20130528/11831_1 /TAXON_ID=216777 /ORGANISM="Proboscia alata, Strain PI-D3" /LENGTH=92 /DNA_ID=CAMNT_0039216575 /DNA_START=25 /DNA_END=300 /DNA_ORIENTATION=+